MGDTLQANSLLEQLLEEVHELRLILNGRLSTVETVVCFLNNTCNCMADRLSSMETLLQRTHDAVQTSHNFTVKGKNGDSSKVASSAPGVGVLATPQGVLRLSGVEDYPEGSWLGDPDCPSKRVRCPITPQNLLHINSTCISAEKMALTLLDYLFSRDELASSNISGRSRKNKKQLDPMMVYGIRCHLQYKFNITTKEWCRICQNMDSKCRSACKRKLKNSSAAPSKFIKICSGTIRHSTKEANISDDLHFDFDSSGIDLNCVKVMNDGSCELRSLQTDSGGGLDPLCDSTSIVLAEDRVLSSAAVDDNTSSSTGSALLLSRVTAPRLTVAPVVIDSISGLTSLASSGSLVSRHTTPSTIAPHPAPLSDSHFDHTLTTASVHSHSSFSIDDHHKPLGDVGGSWRASVVSSVLEDRHEPMSVEIHALSKQETPAVSMSRGGCSLKSVRVETLELQPCSVALSCSPLSLSDQEATPDLEDDQQVIVISGEATVEDTDDVLEIGVVDSLSPHLRDNPVGDEHLTPDYKLLQTHAGFTSSLHLPSSEVKTKGEECLSDCP